MHLPRGRFNLAFAIAALSSLLCMASTTTAHAQSAGWAEYNNSADIYGFRLPFYTSDSTYEGGIGSASAGSQIQLTVGSYCSIVTSTAPTATFYVSTSPGSTGTAIGTVAADGVGVLTWTLPATTETLYFSAYVTAQDYGNDGNCAPLSTTPVQDQFDVTL